MQEIVGVLWFKDEKTYLKALSLFSDPEELPKSFEKWKELVERQCEIIRDSGGDVLRADFDPETFTGWCTDHGLLSNSEGRIGFVKHVELEHMKIAKTKGVK